MNTADDARQATEFEIKLQQARERLSAQQAPWTPCGEKIVAMELPRQEEVYRSAIVITDKARDAEMKTRICEVLAVGPQQLEFAKGDKIMVGLYAGKLATFTASDVVLILDAEEILQVIAVPRSTRLANMSDYQCPNCFSADEFDAEVLRSTGTKAECASCGAAMALCVEKSAATSAQGDGAGL